MSCRGPLLPILSAAGVVAATLAIVPAAGAQPQNDNFAAAHDLGSGSTTAITATNAGATKEASEPNHAGENGGASVWFRWTAPASRSVTISLCGSSFDTLLAVYTGSSLVGLGATQVASANDALCDPQSWVRFNASAGTTYRIAVDGVGGATGTIELDLGLAPPNDRFADAEGLGNAFSAGVTGTNLRATEEAGEPNHAGDPGGASVWYRWTAPASTTFVIHTCESDLDSLLAVYTGSALNSLTPVAQNDDACGNQSVVRFAATAGVTYVVAVDGKAPDTGVGLPSEGAIELVIGAPPANDDFANAEDLGAQPTASITGSNVGAGRETGEPMHAGNAGGASVWYRWQAPNSGEVTVDTCDSDFDTLLGVYTGGAVGALTQVASSDNACGGQSRVTFTASAGATYRIAVDGVNPGAGASPRQGALQLDLTPPPSNDDFASPLDLGSGQTASVVGSNAAASKEVGEPNHAGDAGGASVWYRWTPPTTGTVTLDFCWDRPVTECEGPLAVYTGGTLGALTQVATKRSCGLACGEPARVSFNATAGTPYLIAVDGAAGEEGSFRLEFGLPPPHDAFANAEDLGSSATASAVGTTVGATKQGGEPDHAGNIGAASVWYRWTAPSSGQFRVETCASAFDTLLAIYTGTGLTALTPVASAADGCGNRSRLEFAASTGQIYWIAVDTWRPASFLPPDPGAVHLSLTASAGPSAARDTSPPDSRITKRPRDRTRKKRATFEFTSSEPGSSFECSVDGARFSPCTSPHTVKVRKGRHTFELRATDLAGNPDPSPAVDSWKLRKRR